MSQPAYNVMSTGFGYGSWGGPDNPWGGVYPPLHYYALKKIFPIPDMQGTLNDDLTIEGRHLDNVYYQVDNLLDSMYPDTADAGLTDFERIFALNGMGTIAQRQASVVAAEQALINKNGKMNPAFFIQLGKDLGYTDITIHEGLSDMFIVANWQPPATEMPHALYPLTHIWTWTITSGMIPYPTPEMDRWQALVKKYAPAFTQVIFVSTN
jgi:uncharacterized protein YmfQ (DUF2313 family)